jgi:uncharacterized protein YndB with AHSA1/START domain
MNPLPHQLDRTIVIQATRDVVFRYFTDSARWATWWGAGSTIDARPGGRVTIRYPGPVEVRGEILDVRAPELIVFTYGYVNGQPPIPVGGSRVTIRLEEAPGSSTRLHLTHEFTDAGHRDMHVQGWRYQLSLFGNVVSNEVNAGAVNLVDAWFDAWAKPDTGAREKALTSIASPGVRFHDRFSLTEGLADLFPHIAAAQHFMPGIRLHRVGDVRHCQGTVLVDWVARGADGREHGSGTNVFTLGADGRIVAVTGFWAAANSSSQ